MKQARTRKRSRTGPIAIAGLLAAAVGLTATASYGQSSAATPNAIATNDIVRRVWEANLPAIHTKPVYWIDDSTLLVAASKQPDTVEGLGKSKAWLYVWRLGEQPRPHSAQPDAAAFAYCAARGHVTFLQGKGDGKSEDGRSIHGFIWAGPLGREKEIEKVEIYPNAPPSITTLIGQSRHPVERIDCGYHPDPSMQGLNYVTDSERGYYVVFGKERQAATSDNSEQLSLRRSDGSAQVALPIKRSDVSNASYRAFDGTFLLYRGILSAADKRFNHTEDYFKIWQDTNCWPIWRVEPKSAKADRLCVPYGPWVGDKDVPRATHGFFNAFATRAGYFFTFERVLGPNGIYRFNDGAVREIAKGTIFRTAVSPSGCRIAFFYDPESSKVPSRLVVADLCK